MTYSVCSSNWCDRLFVVVDHISLTYSLISQQSQFLWFYRPRGLPFPRSFPAHRVADECAAVSLDACNDMSQVLIQLRTDPNLYAFCPRTPKTFHENSQMFQKIVCVFHSKVCVLVFILTLVSHAFHRASARYHIFLWCWDPARSIFPKYLDIVREFHSNLGIFQNWRCAASAYL